MKKILLTGVLIAVVFPAVFSHQPYLVMKTNFSQRNPYPINAPEISKAFYGELKGKPDYYKVVPKKPLALYVNILAPDIVNYNTNRFSVAVFERSRDQRSDKLIFTLDGYGKEWKRYYERFGRDWYRMGPEARVPMTTNAVYILKVFSKSNSGRYALATGEVESFPITEILRILGVLPELKRDFFNKK